MADTRQSVRWSLMQRCALRSEDEWANARLQRARIYAMNESHPHGGFLNFEGICVTATSDGGLPYNGFSIEQEFAEVGGSSGLRTLCGSCPANAALDGVAGCTGWLGISPYDQEMDEQLRRLAEELDLSDAVQRVFPPTTLLWFAFWMDERLSTEGMDVLVPLLDAFERRGADQSDGRSNAALQQFVRAMERALYFSLELRVAMSPPGHTDFGWWTTFPHCPRCKAGLSPIAQWGEVPHARVLCAMCDNEFDPATTASTKRMTGEAEDDNLLKTLGEERYRDFATGYLVAQGQTLQDAEARVAKRFAPPDPAVAERRRQAESKLRAKRYFISTVLCAGFEHLQSDAPEDVEERITSHYLLSFSEAQLLLQRAKQWGAEVHSITRITDIEDQEDYVLCRDFVSPEAALQELRARGYDSLFSVVVGVSDDVFAAWKASQR